MRFAILFAAAFALIPTAANACSCEVNAPDWYGQQVNDYLAAYATVVRGTVIETNEPYPAGDLFEVEETLVGNATGVIRVGRFGRNRTVYGPDCSYAPESTDLPMVLLLLPVGVNDPAPRPGSPRPVTAESNDNSTPDAYKFPHTCTMFQVDYDAILRRANELGRASH